MIRDTLRPIVERWLCRSCGGMLGEIEGATVNIRLGVRAAKNYPRQITAMLPCSQTCPVSGTINVRNTNA